MTGEEIRNAINRHPDEQARFIKWWRKENDFVDYELVEGFLDRLDSSQHFSGFELLDMEQMLAVLNRWPKTNVSVEHRTHGDFIHWEHVQDGHKVVEELPFTAASLMHIFNSETGGDTIQ